MKPIALASLLAFSTSVASASIQGDDPALYVIDIVSDVFHEVDPVSGAIRSSLPIPSSTIGGLSADPFSRRLFAVDSESQDLLTIDPLNAAVEVVGPTGLLFPQSVAICPLTGRVFTAGALDTTLSELDRSTGAATPIFGVSVGRTSALEFDPTSGLLYGTALTGGSLATLFRIDLDTLTKVTIGELVGIGIFPTGLAFDASGQLFGVSNGSGSGLYRIDKNTAQVSAVETDLGLGNALTATFDDDNSVGEGYCDALANSTGAASEIAGIGSSVVGDMDLTLVTTQLPPNSLCLYLVAEAEGYVAAPGNSPGFLCLDGEIGRFMGSGQVQLSGADGSVSLPVDLASLPRPGTTVAALPGDTWYFQTWHRDSVQGTATSNLSNGLRVLMR